MKNTGEYKISRSGEFVDKALEKEFFNKEISGAIRYIRPVTIALGLLYMLFIIPDYFLIDNANTFTIIFAIRLVILSMVFIFYIFIRRMKDYRHYPLLLTALELVVALSFVVIYYFYESPDFLIQGMGLIIIFIAIYLIPNKWINLQIVTITTSLIFFVMSACFMDLVEFSHFSAGIVYIFIVILLSSISFYKTNYYKRVQYIDRRELLRISYTDSLTGINNRTKFNDELTNWIKYTARYKTPLSLAIFDFDDFKLINDNYGHMAGDQVIIETAGIIKNAIRQTDIFARWGGDEFVLLLPNTDFPQAKELIERLRMQVASHNFEIGQPVKLSFGLVSPGTGENEDSILRRADKLLYEAKKTGKNKVAF